MYLLLHAEYCGQRKKAIVKADSSVSWSSLSIGPQSVEKKPKSPETRTFRMPSPEVEEAGCSREMQSSLSQLNLNESPIKSFVPVSEATNCLVDFKDQFAFRSRTKSGRGKKRKS
ncbi:BRCA1-A complex subunit RAP80 [Apodemus speciosus]|uniref:BRCA1-A complex subunit RAP80 n=1 Tax=Apodemus speciosus TaxID=105296 RepID=A0ABQ0FG22_APOSI